MTARKTDRVVKAVVSLLESDQEWDGPEEMAVALVNLVDSSRQDKQTYVAVMQFGTEIPFYVGIGPFPGKKSAANAAGAHPAFEMARGTVVVPVWTADQMAAKLEELDANPTLKGDWAIVREDAALFKKGWKGKMADRKKYQDGAA